MELPKDDRELYQRRLRTRQRSLARLGVSNIRCFCGETDPVCFEADHIYRREYDPTCWGICCNCHKKRSARGWSEHPMIGIEPGDPYARAGHMLLGVRDYLTFIGPHLHEAAALMFKLADGGKPQGE